MFVPTVHLQHIRTALAILTLAFGFFLWNSGIVLAAEVAITPSTGTYTSGQTFTVTVQVNPQGKNVNAVEAKLTFDNTKFSVVSISKTGSVFSLWTTEPTFSNSAGTIEFGGGSPTPFSSRSTLVSMTLRTLAEGSGNITVSSASVLAADGLGTNVYTGAVNATLTISKAETPAPKPEEPPAPTPTPTPEPKKEEEKKEDSNAAITFGDPPRVPEAGSTVFLEPDTWYATKVGVFTWEVPFDVDEIAFDVSTSSEFTPVTKFKPPVEEFATDATKLNDGIQYFTLQYHNQVGWGGILHRKIMVDTVPPEKFSINVRAGNSQTAFPFLTFEAQDTTSGIEKYTLAVADNEPVEITPDMAKLGYLLGKLEDGTYTVKVTAYDFAGNTTVAASPVIITAGWKPEVVKADERSVWDIVKEHLFTLILLLVIIGQFVFAMRARREHEAREQKLRKETKEIQDQMEKIFSALRDEIYDQINAITKRERLSKKEREAVEGLNQALEVSETLIEKEITDVSKILK